MLPVEKVCDSISTNDIAFPNHILLNQGEDWMLFALGKPHCQAGKKFASEYMSAYELNSF